MLRSKNVATPLTAATGVVPLSAPPPGLLPRAMLTLPVKVGTRFPSASSARTFTAGLIWWPAIVVPGSAPEASRVAARGAPLNEAPVAVRRPAALPATQQPGLGVVT